MTLGFASDPLNVFWIDAQPRFELIADAKRKVGRIACKVGEQEYRVGYRIYGVGAADVDELARV